MIIDRQEECFYERMHQSWVDLVAVYVPPWLSFWEWLSEINVNKHRYASWYETKRLDVTNVLLFEMSTSPVSGSISAYLVTSIAGRSGHLLAYFSG